MIGTAGLVAPTKIRRTPLAVPPEVNAEIVTENVPAVVGVPLMIPVEVLTVRPAGRPGAEKDVADLDAVIG